MKVLVSIGNPLKGDDNIANIVLDLMFNCDDAKKIKAEVSPENYIEQMKKCEKIIFLDALEFKGKTGEVRLFSPKNLEDVKISTHSIPISLVNEFIPNAKIFVIGIQPKKIEPKTELSREMQQKLPRIISQVQGIVQRL